MCPGFYLLSERDLPRHRSRIKHVSTHESSKSAEIDVSILSLKTISPTSCNIHDLVDVETVLRLVSIEALLRNQSVNPISRTWLLISRLSALFITLAFCTSFGRITVVVTEHLSPHAALAILPVDPHSLFTIRPCDSVATLVVV